MADPACVIGAGIEIHGTLSGAGDLVMCGRLEGQLALQDDHVTIDKTGVVIADVHSRELAVHGEVQGDVDAEGGVAVHSGARMVGNVRTESFELSPEAQFYGFLDMAVELPEGIEVELPKTSSRPTHRSTTHAIGPGAPGSTKE